MQFKTIIYSKTNVFKLKNTIYRFIANAINANIRFPNKFMLHAL